MYYYVKKKSKNRKECLQMRFIDSSASERNILDRMIYFININDIENQFPTKNECYDKMNGEHISNNDSHRAYSVWDTIKYHTSREYSEIQLKTLCDVFENFRKHCLHKYIRSTEILRKPWFIMGCDVQVQKSGDKGFNR